MPGQAQPGTDNNCQNLNIWTPGVGDDGARPVMVWLHGGGFSNGSGNDQGYHKERATPQEVFTTVCGSLRDDG